MSDHNDEEECIFPIRLLAPLVWALILIAIALLQPFMRSLFNLD